MNILTFILDHLEGVRNGTKTASEVTPIFKAVAGAAVAAAEPILLSEIGARVGVTPTKEGVANYVIDLVDQHESDTLTSDLLNTYLSGQLLGTAYASPVPPAAPSPLQTTLPLPTSAILPPETPPSNAP